MAIANNLLPRELMISALRDAKTWADVHRGLLPYNAVGNEDQQRAGKAFEWFAWAYLQVAPEYRGEYREVLHETEIRPWHREKLVLNEKDFGVDLLLEARDGRFICAQCKFKTDESDKVSWSESKLANWLAESIASDGVMLFSNASGCDGHTARKAMAHWESFDIITAGCLIDVDVETLEACLTILEGENPKAREPDRPRPHQQEAIDDVLRGFETNARGKLIAACGSGKTHIAMFVHEELGSKRTLLLVPSLHLVRQSRASWASNLREPVPYLCVCSESDIDKPGDEVVAHTYDIPGLVTTRADKIRAFAETHPRCVVFGTYHSIEAVIESGVEFDLCIADEAHRTASSRKKRRNYYVRVHDGELRAKRRLYMTATPRIIGEKAKEKLRDRRPNDDPFDVICDMEDEEIFGPEFHCLTFGQAIELGILSDYKLVVLGVSDEELRQHVLERDFIDTGGNAEHAAVSYAIKSVRKNHGARRVLTFHSKVQTAELFAEMHGHRDPDAWVSSVSGQIPTNLRKVKLDKLAKSDLAVLASARCLNEGVDVPSVDGVVFADPKQSLIDIAQAAGRALRLDPKNSDKVATIVLPVFYGEGDEPEAVAEDTAFAMCLNVIRAIASNDHRLMGEIRRIELGAGKRAKGRHTVQIIDESEHLVIENFDQRFAGKLLEHVGYRTEYGKREALWKKSFRRLVQFHQEHGHWFPTENDDRKLNQIVYLLRADYGEPRHEWASLNPQKLADLNAVGFEWEREDALSHEQVSEGLVSRPELIAMTGISSGKIKDLEEKRVLVRAGTRGRTLFYKLEESMARIKEHFGLTVDDTNGLCTQEDIARECGLPLAMVKYRIAHHNPPYEVALSHDRAKRSYSRFYRLEDVRPLFPDTSYLLTIAEVGNAIGMTEGQARDLLKKSKIEPTNGAYGLHMYARSTPEDLRKMYGVTLIDTTGLMNITDFARHCGKNTTQIRERLNRGYCVPKGVGFDVTGRKTVSEFFEPEERDRYPERLGANLSLLTETEFAKAVGVTKPTIAGMRANGHLVPAGKAYEPVRNRLVYGYSQEQVDEFKKAHG